MTDDPLARALIALGESEADATRMVAKHGEGRPSIARALWLRLAWRLVIDERTVRDGEPAWIEGWLREARHGAEPPSGVAAALERMLAAGADPDDLTDVVRAMQIDLLFNVCNLLDGEGLAELRAAHPSLASVSWRLHERRDGVPAAAIESLHESLESYDPTGREGRPRKRGTSRP